MKKRIPVENTRLLCFMSIPHIYGYVWFYDKFNFIAGVWDYILFVYTQPVHQKKEINHDIFRGYDVYSELKTIEQLAAYVEKEIGEEYKESYLELIQKLDFHTLSFSSEEIEAINQADLGFDEVRVCGTVDDIELYQAVMELDEVIDCGNVDNFVLESELGEPVSREKKIEYLERGVWFG